MPLKRRVAAQQTVATLQVVDWDLVLESEQGFKKAIEQAMFGAGRVQLCDARVASTCFSKNSSLLGSNTFGHLWEVQKLGLCSSPGEGMDSELQVPMGEM